MVVGEPEERIPIDDQVPVGDIPGLVADWVERFVPASWREAAARGGPAAVRQVRSRSDYEAWYPLFGRSGLVAPAWPRKYGGLGVSGATARLIEAELRPLNLGRLNPLGLNQAASALLAYGTEEQRLRFLPPILANEEVWCQLFSEPGAGSDLAALATRADLDGEEWIIDGQKVWTTWAHRSDYAVLLARTDPSVPKREGLTFFLISLHQAGVEVRPLRHIGGEVDFNEVFLDGARVPEFQRVGPVGAGWKVAAATLSSERQMVAGSGSGGVDRIGGSSARRLIPLSRTPDVEASGRGWSDPVTRQKLVRLYTEERIRDWTNQRVRARAKAGLAPGPESSIGKIHQAHLNQAVQLLAADLLGAGALAWPRLADEYGEDMPFEIKGMLRSRANSIEGGTTEINKNIVAERVLGLPREPDPWRDAAWQDVPRG
jgi:alkylation response protein AidB-like acyl-CoA dehydrogenase